LQILFDVTEEKDRLYVFDLIRSAAVILVILGHYLCARYDYDNAGTIWVKCHPVGVGMFFFISGYLIFLTLTKSNSLSFLPQRYFRLAPALLAGILILGAFHISYPPIGESIFSIKSILMGLLFIGDFFQSMNVFGIDMWTLHTETRFYLLAYFVYFYILRKNINNTRALVLGYIVSIIVILSAVAGLCIKYPGFHFSDPKWNILCILYLYFGAFLFLFHKSKINSFHVVVLWITNIFLILVTKKLAFGISWGAAIRDNYLVGCMLCMGFIAIESWLPRWKLASLIAFISYPLYLIHHPLIAHGGVIAIIPIIAIAYLISVNVEHPMMKWAKQYF
jgi:peptidoglycan/LPS O-acetylase OafA/YrhL